MKRSYNWLIVAATALVLVMVMSVCVFADDYSTTLEDGEYVVDKTAYTILNSEGSTPKNPLICEKVIVENGQASGVFTSTSKSMTHVYLGSVSAEGDETTLYDPETDFVGENVYPTSDITDDAGKVTGKTVTIPVKLNEGTAVSVRTTAMSSTKWIPYTYTIRKPSINQGKYAGITYSLGMISASDNGTGIVLNNDATVTLNVTTKPMTSTKFTKIAMSPDPLTDENIEQVATTIPVTVVTAVDTYVYKGVDYGPLPYYWSTFSYTLPVEAITDPINISAYNVLKKVDDATKTYVEDLTEAKWAYKSTWTINCTEDLLEKLRAKQKELGSGEAADKIGSVINEFEAKAAIEAAKADLENEALVNAALEACDKLTDAQKVKLSEDIKVIQDAKATIDKKAKEAAEKAEIAKVKAGKVKSFKVKAGKKKVTFTWKKNTTFAGYELKYKVGKKTKTIKIKSAKTVKKVIKKLKRRQKVLGQIRGYKKIGGKIYYGKWAKSKTVKVK